MNKNRICSLLGIRYPIIQAPMNWVSGAKLAAAVSNAGGLGTLGPNAGSKDITTDVEETGERYRDQIREIKSLTQAPFAVNIPVGFGAQRKYSKKIAGLINEVKTASEVMDDVMGAISSRFEELRLKLGDFV